MRCHRRFLKWKRVVFLVVSWSGQRPELEASQQSAAGAGSQPAVSGRSWKLARAASGELGGQVG